MKIGIVTISYNQGQFVEEAIRSVSARSKPWVQHVIVDPGSDDGSRETIGKFRENGWFHRCLLEPDAGPSDGLNKGICACDAEVVGCLNADDRYRPGTLEYVREVFARNKSLDVLIGGGAIIDESSRPRLRRMLPTPFSLKNYLSRAATAVQQGTFYRRGAWERAGGFNEDNHACWDGELLVDMALNRARFRSVWKILGEFRIHKDSISGSGRMYDEYQRERARIYRKIEQAGNRRSWGVERVARRPWSPSGPNVGQCRTTGRA